jgi:hypothetical protein
VGYSLVGWALRQCKWNTRDKLDKTGRVGYLMVGWIYAPVIGVGRIN